MQGYKWARWRVWLCRLAAVLSLGLILIVFHWRPRLAVLARCYSCPLGLADVLLITVKVVPIQIIGLFDYEILFFRPTKPVNQMEIYFRLFFPSSGQIWTEARSRGPQGGVGGRQVGINSSFSTWRDGKKKLLTYFISSSLGLIKELEDYEWRDTIQLYKEEVRKN